MGLATTGGAEVEGESQVKKSRRAIGTGGRLAGLRLRLRLRLAGWLLYSIFIGHARGSNSGRLACEATCGTTWAYYQLPITKWPRQSGAPVGAAPPTRSQLRLQRHTQFPVQAQTMAATSPP